MQDAPDPTRQSSSTQEQDNSAQGAKRSRQSSYTTESTEAGPSDAPSGSRNLLNPSVRHRGLAEDSSEMYRSSTPPDASSSGSIKYTRTGRVSKASKGQRVHHCDECGKTYTRAEHLRRHQQNHKPGAFPCDVPGCQRSFYREDLLLRHKSRHNDPNNPPSRRQSIASMSSAPEGGMAVPQPPTEFSLANPPTSESATASETPSAPPSRDAQQSNEPSRAPKRLPVPPHELPLPGVPMAVGEPLVPFSNPLSRTTLSPSVTTAYDDDDSDDFPGCSYYPAYASRVRYPSDASLLGYGQPHSSSRSPVSTGSSTIYPLQWPSQISIGPGLANYMYNNATQLPCVDQRILNCNVLGLTMAETRDAMEQRELELPGTPTAGSSFDDGIDFDTVPDSSHYLGAYWSGVHEQYPVVHQPTFVLESASPLLRAAMLALGGQALGERTDLANARVLHEKCLKVLKKRTMNNTESYRVSDMQAIFLVELYSVFKSRRPPLQFSRHFEKIYQVLSNDPSAIMRAQSEAPSDDSFTQGSLETSISTMYTECTQRLLLACYALEQQCNALFGRSSAIGYTGLSNILPFPTSQLLWDKPFTLQDDLNELATFDRLQDALGAARYATQQRHDTFQSSLMISTICDPVNDSVDGLLLLSGPLAPASPTRLAYHTAMLCKNTPVRDLLAVAGESWVMAEKLGTQAEFSAAQIDTRSWAIGSYPDSQQIERAMAHALRILAIYKDNSRTGLLYQEWAVYLATVVLWARAYVQSDTRMLSANLTEAALDHSISEIVSAGVNAIDYPSAHNALRWTKMRIERGDVPHTCGLVSGALDVLGKLVTGGGEDGWM